MLRRTHVFVITLVGEGIPPLLRQRHITSLKQRCCSRAFSQTVFQHVMECKNRPYLPCHSMSFNPPHNSHKTLRLHLLDLSICHTLLRSASEKWSPSLGEVSALMDHAKTYGTRRVLHAAYEESSGTLLLVKRRLVMAGVSVVTFGCRCLWTKCDTASQSSFLRAQAQAACKGALAAAVQGRSSSLRRM